jgi:hypothetical protein
MQKLACSLIPYSTLGNGNTIQRNVMINVQNRKNGHLNDFTTQNERYQDFLKFALNRIIETALYYESQARISHHTGNKQFLYFLAGKKRVQHVILEIVATNRNNNNSNPAGDYPNISKNDTEYICLADSKPEIIIKYAHERAEKDLNLYTSLAALEEDIHTRKLLLTLSKMARDFIQDVTTGYSKFASTQLHPQIQSTGISKNFIIKRPEETPVR